MNTKFLKALPVVYLVMMGILTAWFLTLLAIANPLCTNCSVNMVQWAMPRAELLVFGWLIAGTGAVWLYGRDMLNYCKMLKEEIQES